MSRQLLDVPTKHPFSFSALADRAWNALAETTMRISWTPLSNLAQGAVLTLMQRITVGQLRIITSDHTYTFPSSSAQAANERPGVKAELRVVNDAFWVRLAAMGDLGFAEAYMYGDVECDDLVSLFKVFLENRQNLEGIDSRFSYLYALPRKITSFRFLNTIGNSRSNISAHYDISNAMFAGFLSEDMTYSCAIFEDLDADLKTNISCNPAQGLRRIGNGNYKHLNGHALVNGTVHLVNGNGNGIANGHAKVNGHANGYAKVNGRANGHAKINGHANGHAQLENDELYVAQMRKLDHIIQKAKIQPGHRVLEIGSGWGSMAIRITQSIPDTTVDTLTLSVHQQALAQERIAAAGLSDRIMVHLMDYRAMPQEWEGMFDRVVSLEMVEAVGEEFLETYWKVVDWALKPQTGAGVVQVITIPETRFDSYRSNIDFIQKWVIFPGGQLPTITLLMDTLQAGSKNRLIVDSISNIGPHYARTLREWRRRFEDRFEDVVVPALKAEYPAVMGDGCENGRQEIEVFKRKWMFYYCYSEIGFTTRALGDHIITFVREGYQDFGCDTFV